MNRAVALLVLVALVALTALAIVGEWRVALALLVASVAAMRARRRAFVLFAGTAIAINALVLWLVGAGAFAGVVGGARLAAAAGANLAVLSWIAPARLLDALRLPPRATALLAAVLLSAHDVARDFQRIRDARRLDGDWPDGRVARVRASARILPPLLLAAHRRAHVRRDALRLAGHDLGAWFVPVVAVAALAMAGRLAFLALPNVALTYVVAFLGGMLYGPWVAIAGVALGMALTDFMLSGLYPLAFVNVPAMALLALMGALLRNFDFVGGSRADRVAGAAFAAFFGLVGTMLFSVATDVLTWLLVYRDEPAALLPLVVAGLAFNVLPSIANALLFALSVQPTARAFAAARAPTPASPAAPAAAPRPEPDADPAAPHA